MLKNHMAYYMLIALAAVSTALSAGEVTLVHRGMTLNADYNLATGESHADEALLITHGALAHRDMEIIAALRKLLGEQGYTTLAINLGLGLNNRHGMYDCKETHRHRNEDAVEEIALWSDWLVTQGFRRVTVIGHSRGGAQTALYAATRANSALQSVILMAPATAENSSARAYQKRYEQTLAPLLKRAQMLIDSGKGEKVLEHVGLLTCSNTSATAASFVSYYGQDTHLDTPSLIPQIKVPALVVVAGADETVIGLNKKVEPLAGHRVQMTIVDGADHMFRDLYTEDAVESIVTFLQTLRDQDRS